MSDHPSKRQKTTEDSELFEDDLVKEITLPEPEQRVFNGIRVPLVLTWSADAPLDAAVRWISANQTWLEDRLCKHGGILFRGFPVPDADAFDSFVSSFKGWEDLSYTDSLSYAVRLHVVGRVCTTNEGKMGGMVFHHEQAQTPKWPSKLLFYCAQQATVGGGTGICPSDLVYERLKQDFPDFVAKCEEGVRYTAYLKAEPDSSKGVGRGWKSFFGRDNKPDVEKRMEELGYTWEWVGEGEEEVLASTSPVLPAVRVAPGTQRKVFFNQVVAMLANAQEFRDRAQSQENSEDKSDKLDMDRFLKFADGSSVDVDVMRKAKQICDDLAVELNWQNGDIGLLDNYLVMHARRSFEGPRRVLASLVN